VVGEEIASEPKPLDTNVEKVTDELGKESGHRRVRVSEHNLVSMPRPLGPIKHAAAGVSFAQTSRPPPTLLLSRSPSGSGFRSHNRVCEALTLVKPISCLQHGVLCVSQFNVTNPNTH
jgi:hypothetical protein